jgi:exopolysaccharide biosynthesis polyprenyl glycosylphosphotransferase
MLERLGQRLAGRVLLGDILLTLVSLYLSMYLRLNIDFGKFIFVWKVELPWQLYGAVFVIWTVVFFILVPQQAIFSRSLLEAISRLVTAIGLSSLTFAGLLYLSLRDVSRLQFLYFVATDFILLLLFHLLIRTYFSLRHHHRWESRVLIVGGGEMSKQLAQEFARRPWTGIHVVGHACDNAKNDAVDGVIQATGLPLLGAVDETVEIVSRHHINEVVFTLPPNQHERIARLSLALSEYPVMVHMVPGILDLAFARTPAHALGGIPMISLRESALRDSQRIVKRLFDVAASATLLLLLSPLMILIAVLIKVESAGPIFFCQERIGAHGRRFKMIKFRSMYQDAERRWQEVAVRDAEGKLVHKQANDPRITRVGRLIRRTSLDELPQLFNVLFGEMSLVGPRPEMPYITAEYQPWQWQRFRVPPGITGWWQVNGRSDKPMHLHTDDDLYYIQNYSFWLDLFILLKTVIVVFRGQGAY